MDGEILVNLGRIYSFHFRYDGLNDVCRVGLSCGRNVHPIFISKYWKYPMESVSSYPFILL